jgi:hypothetical protein
MAQAFGVAGDLARDRRLKVMTRPALISKTARILGKI